MLLAALAVAPGLFLLSYFLARDRLRPEPRHLVARVFFLGAVAALAAALLEGAVFRATGITLEGGLTLSALVAAGVIGVTEETVKFLPVFLGVYRHVEFNEVLDGIIYAVAAALGFATVENLVYVLGGGAAVAVGRAFLAVPGHAFFGATMGFNMGMAKFAGAKETLWLVSGIGLAALAHTIYDVLALSQGPLALAVVPLVIVLWRRAMAQTRVARAMDDRQGAP